MKSVKTFQSSIQKTLTRKNTSTDMIGEEVEEYCRIATGKALPGPDDDLNRQQIANILKNRLQMKNAHKQWLAVLLVQKILQECGQMIAPARGQIIQEVAHIAAKPMNRYSTDLPGQQKAKTAAFSLLRNYGREGQDALRGVAGIGRGPMGLGESTSEPVSPKSAAASGAAGGTGTSGARRLRPWPQLREAVQTAIATANSHTEMMQDMLLNLSKEGSDDYDFQRGFLNDLSGEIKSFRNAFEQLLASLANHDNDEANSLMVSALETVEMMNNALQLKDEVTTAKDDPSASTSVPQSRAPAPAMARAPAAPTFQVGDPTPGRLSQSTNRPSQAALPVAQPSPFDAIAELQQALAEPSRDPFGASQAPQHSAVDPFAPRQTMTNQAPQQQAADPFAASSLYGGPGAGYTGNQGGQPHPLQAGQALPAYPVSATMSAANPFSPGVSFPHQQQQAPQDPFSMPSFMPQQANAAQQGQFASPARQPFQGQQANFPGYGSPGPSNANYNSPTQQQQIPVQGGYGSPYQQPYGAQPGLQNGYGSSASAINGSAAGGYGSPTPTPAWSHQTPQEAYAFPQALPTQQPSPQPPSQTAGSQQAGLPSTAGQGAPSGQAGNVYDRFQQHKQARHAQQQSLEMQQIARPTEGLAPKLAQPQPSVSQAAPSLMSPNAASQVAAPRSAPGPAAPQLLTTGKTGSQPAKPSAMPNGTGAAEEMESEWDMFFADRVGGTAGGPPAKSAAAASHADEFDELVSGRRTSDQ